MHASVSGTETTSVDSISSVDERGPLTEPGAMCDEHSCILAKRRHMHRPETVVGITHTNPNEDLTHGQESRY